MMSERDHYEILQIDQKATSEEVQSAYYRMVRKHPPEKDPDGFQKVQAAYEVLSQPTTRREYDDTRRADPETQILIDQGRKLLESSSTEATTVFKQALVRQPESTVIRDLLTQALLAVKDFPAAEKQARKVLAMDPNNPSYSARVGTVLRAADKDAEALPYFRKALLLDAEIPHHRVQLAYLLNYLDRTEEAVTLLEQGIRLDGRVDFDDFIYFQCLCTIYTMLGRYPELARTQARIREIIPPDPDTASYVAWFYYSNALSMAQVGNFEGAVRSIEEAAALDDSLPDIQDMMKRLRSSRAALEELPRLSDDESLEMALRMTVVTVAYLRTLGENERNKEIFNQASSALNALIETEDNNLQEQVLTLRQRYPAVAELAHELLDKIIELQREVPKRFVPLTCPSCGDRSRTEKPTFEVLIRGGMSPAEARGLLSSHTPEAILGLIAFRCDECGTKYTGQSSVPVAASEECFVVTAACGNELAYPVRVMRSFRDQVLLNTWLGRLFVRIYRRVGPLAARLINDSPRVKRQAYKLVYWISRRIEPHLPSLVLALWLGLCLKSGARMI